MLAAPPQQSAAQARAIQNFAANHRALCLHHPHLAEQLSTPSPAEWLLARDGYLTALDESGRWHSGCSLPLRTARTILAKMDLKSPVACFLAPTHAAQLRVTLDRMSAAQALIAIVPDERDLQILLACDDFEAPLAAGRLFFAATADWPEHLATLIERNDGLPTPGQFIRTSLVDDDAIQSMIVAAQQAFTHETTRRAALTRALYTTPFSRPACGPRPDAPASPICVITPTAFRLWDDAGGALDDIARQESFATLNPDDPRQASPVALARAISNCTAVFLPNLGRADLHPDLPASTRVLTWATGPRLPRFQPRAPHDALLVFDDRLRRAARAAGWPAARLFTAAWPAASVDRPGAGLGVIADTVPLATPAFDLSSHRVLWDSIARDLADDPFAVDDDAPAYLARWAKRVNIDPDGIDHGQFLDRLILPAHAQGLARWLLAAGLLPKLFGRGWDQIADFAPYHVGEIPDRESHRRAVDSCAALVHAWPTAHAHPVESAGRPVLRRTFKSRELWVAEAKRLTRTPGPFEPRPLTPLSADVVRRALEP